MKLIVVALLICVATSMGASIKLAASTGAGSFIYLSSCDNTGYYKCGSSGSTNVDIQCDLIDTTGDLDDNDSGAILQLAEAKNGCDVIRGDDSDFYAITLYGEPNTIIIENIQLGETFNGAPMYTFCDKLDSNCDTSKVYGKDKNNECRTPGWESYGKYGQLKLESDAQYARCATYLLEAKYETPNEALVHAGFNCGDTCPDYYIPAQSGSISSPRESTFYFDFDY